MKSSKFSFIVYDSANAPRYFEIKKSLFRFLFLGLPTATLLFLIGLFLANIYFKKNRLATSPPSSPHPSHLLKELKQENQNLKNDLEKLQKENLQYTSQTKPQIEFKMPHLLNSLQLFKPQRGQQNITESIEIKTQQTQVRTYRKNLKINFTIVNMKRAGLKTEGHIFILMQAENQIHIWPKNVFHKEPLSINFNSGESFSTFRFRPVSALFPLPKTDKVFFKVLIFSKQGDLMLEKMIPHLL